MVLKSCLLLFLLLSSLSTAVEDLTVCEDGVTADPDQCDKYWQCQQGVLTPLLCPDGLVFDKSKAVAAFQVNTGAPPSDGSRCSYPFSVDCRDRPSLQAPQPRENCPRQNGYFPVPGRCDEYWFCDANRPGTKHVCPVSLVFAPDQGRCTWIGEAKRPGCEATDTFHEEFLCPESGYGEYLRYPDPADCRGWYVCVQGVATRSVCPAGQAFNPTTEACSLEADLPTGLCSPEDIWADRNSTESEATKVRTRTRTRNPGQRVKVTDLEDSQDSEAESLVCGECRRTITDTQKLPPRLLSDNSVLVGQQRAQEQSLFLDDTGKTTTTPLPRRLRTRTRIRGSNGLRTKEAQEAETGQEAAIPRRRGVIRGSVSKETQTSGEAGQKFRRRPLTRVRSRGSPGSSGTKVKNRGRPRMRGSVRRPVEDIGVVVETLKEEDDTTGRQENY